MPDIRPTPAGALSASQPRFTAAAASTLNATSQRLGSRGRSLSDSDIRLLSAPASRAYAVAASTASSSTSTENRSEAAGRANVPVARAPSSWAPVRAAQALVGAVQSLFVSLGRYLASIWLALRTGLGAAPAAPDAIHGPAQRPTFAAQLEPYRVESARIAPSNRSSTLTLADSATSSSDSLDSSLLGRSRASSTSTPPTSEDEHEPSAPPRLTRPTLREQRAGSCPTLTLSLAATPSYAMQRGLSMGTLRSLQPTNRTRLWHTGDSAPSTASDYVMVWAPAVQQKPAVAAKSAHDVLRARLYASATSSSVGTTPSASAWTMPMASRRYPSRWHGPGGVTIASTAAFRALLKKTVQDEPGIADGHVSVDARLPVQFERDAFRDKPRIILHEAGTNRRLEREIAIADSAANDDVAKATMLRSAGDWLEELCKGDLALVRQVSWFLTQNTLNGVHLSFAMESTVHRKTTYFGDKTAYSPLFRGEEQRSLRARPAAGSTDAAPIVAIEVDRKVLHEMTFINASTGGVLTMPGRFSQQLRIELLREGDAIVQRNLRLDLVGNLAGKPLHVAMYP